MTEPADSTGSGARRILLLGAEGMNARNIMERVVRDGNQLYVATRPQTLLSPRNASQITALLRTELLDDSRARVEVIEFAKHHRVNGVLTVDEFLTPLAACTAEVLGVPGNDTALARVARDKGIMAAAFERAGIRIPRTILPRSVARLQEEVAEGRMPLPIVLKPAAGAGSRGVTVVEDFALLEESFSQIQSMASPAMRSGRGGRRVHDVIAQEYIHGEHFSVEAFTRNDLTHFAAITRKSVSAGHERVELGHVLPADIEHDRRTEILKQVSAAITCAGIRNSASHSEVVVADDGRCYVVEIAARLAAGQIGTLMARALGIDPWQVCIDIALDRPLSVQARVSRVAAVEFLASSYAGKLRAVRHLPPSGGDVVTVKLLAAPGDSVRIARENADRIGYFIVLGDDAQTVQKRRAELSSLIEIGVEGGPQRRL